MKKIKVKVVGSKDAGKLVDIQDFTVKTSSGLMFVQVQFGMLREPASPEEVAAAFVEVAENLRIMADGIDIIERTAPGGAGERRST